MKRIILCVFVALISVSSFCQKFDNLAQTPPMGWNSWNKFACNINENIVREIADAMVSTGLKDAGYEYIVIDDCWHGQRDSLGFIQADPERFPSGIKVLADYVHSKGLKFGIYSDAGRKTCGGRPGSFGHEYQDALQYARWGVDYLKYDWCETENINPKGAYTLMRDALFEAGRPILFSMCEWGDNKPWEWAQDVGHIWRTTGDIYNCFDCIEDHGTWKSFGVLAILDMQEGLRKYAGPGHWNDPDMLEVGNGMPVNEDRAHFSLWAMICAPLILGNDIRNMSPETKTILENKDVIAINQDKLGIQGLKYSTEDGIEIWFKPLENGDWAVCFLNRSKEEKTIEIRWTDYSFTDEISGKSPEFDKITYTLKNLWTGKEEGNTQKSIKRTIPSYDVLMYRLKNPFIHIENEIFTINEKPYYYIGTNFWYGAILGSTGEGGNRERLLKELDFMKENGIDNLRILVGADGENGTPFRVEPTLQKSPGVYNDTIFEGLDFLLSEMGKRKMHAVLYLGNSWEWTGGYMQYLEWTGHGKAPIPGVDGWPAFMEYVKQFHQCDSCKQLFKQYTHDVITRSNRYTGMKYTNDPAIMSWQIANEPRAFSDENKPAYEQWLKDMAAYIKSLDSNHLVSTGSEGSWGSENDMELYKRIHSGKNIDYLTIHIWPKNWSWINSDNIPQTVDNAITFTEKYIQEHLVFADSIHKPMVIEEFGMPRDNHQYNLQDPTTSRDKYYEFIFKQIESSAQQKGELAGCNFWAWGGFARPAPDHIFWQKGDDYMGDPGQEEQGLNAVFDTDSTVKLIRLYNEKLKFTPKSPKGDLESKTPQ